VRRVGIYGWGIVAPRSADVAEFERNLEGGQAWLSPFEGFGPSNFLVGEPKFDFDVYRPWLEERFPPNRFRQLTDKMDTMTLYAIGSFIQALGYNPGIEQALREAGTQAHVYVGTGLGNVPTISRQTLALHRAQRRWNRFWSQPERNAPLARHLCGEQVDAAAPPNPSAVMDADDRELAEDDWFAYWAPQSAELHVHLAKLRAIAGLTIDGDIDSGKLHVLREQARRLARLKEESQTPEPPWMSVSPNLLWNIGNTPAAQISMLGHITGLSFAPVAACSTFGLSLKLGMDAIRSGEAKFVVVGATDPAPHPLTVGGFYNARVLAADGDVSKPLSQLKGTHVAGGSAIWILGDVDYCQSRGFKPIGLEPVSVALTSDAEHIITPSKEGPQHAIRLAMERASATPADVVTWDLHATATPGDYQEVKNLGEVLPPSVLLTARKGTFGHGMGACGGWELTAQHLGMARGQLFPTPLHPSELNVELRRLHERFVFDENVSAPSGMAGKLSMGIGGINACVISRPW
jgi:3-oxoacyl-[acyl-carrier-protein] synthase II